MAYNPEQLIPVDFRKELSAEDLTNEEVQEFLDKVIDQSIIEDLRNIIVNKTAGVFTNMFCVNEMSTKEINDTFIDPKRDISKDENETTVEKVFDSQKFIETSIVWNCAYDSESINNDSDTMIVDEILTDIGVGNYPKKYREVEPKDWIDFVNNPESVCVSKGFIGYNHKPQYAFAIKNDDLYYIGVFDMVKVFYADYLTDGLIPIKPRHFIVYDIGDHS